ncbi:MAG: 30S ribosomal protein S14 [Candidatus Hodgkinia cicadicola]|nr:MAG: 30S ribosomal protein S14 [Candidatus Hodgkinia cicadicola]
MSRLGPANNANNIDEMFQKHKAIRLSLRLELNNKLVSMRRKQEALAALAQLPRRSSATRQKSRCFITGRTKGYYRLFGMSRIMLRQLANAGRLPGVVKSSW